MEQNLLRPLFTAYKNFIRYRSHSKKGRSHDGSAPTSVHQRTCHVNPFTFLVLSVPHPNFSTISEMDRRFVTFIGYGCDVTRRLWQASTGQITGSKASDKMAPSLISYAHNETRRRQKWADSLHAKLNYRFRRQRIQKSVVTRHGYWNQRRLNIWLWRGKGIQR